MDCREARTHLLDWRRGALTGETGALVAAHLAECAACRHEDAADRELSAVLAERLPRLRAPDSLRRRLAPHARQRAEPNTDLAPHARQGAEPNTPHARRPPPGGAAGARGLGRAVPTLLAMAAGAVIAVIAMVLWRGRSVQPAADAEAMVVESVNDHLRVLYSDRPIEVLPGIHQVKPWFEGRLDFAPAVGFAGDDDFPLQGGAIAWFVDRKAATFVYKRRLHLVTLFVFRAQGLPWPSSATEPIASVGSAAAAVRTSRGFHVVLWQKADQGYALVSDVDPRELRLLAGKIAGE
jgi:anti-sigma factor RsiW